MDARKPAWCDGPPGFQLYVPKHLRGWRDQPFRLLWRGGIQFTKRLGVVLAVIFRRSVFRGPPVLGGGLFCVIGTVLIIVAAVFFRGSCIVHRIIVLVVFFVVFFFVVILGCGVRSTGHWTG